MPRTKTIDDDAVLDATVAVIGRVGPDRLTLAGVGHEAGLSPSAILQRFGSRQELLRSVARRAAETDDPLAPASAIERSPLSALVDALVERAHPFRRPEAFTNHLAFLRMDLEDRGLLELARLGSQRFRFRIREILDAAVIAGELVSTDTDALAESLEVMYNGALLIWAIHRVGTPGEALRSHLERLLAPRRPVGATPE